MVKMKIKEFSEIQKIDGWKCINGCNFVTPAMTEFCGEIFYFSLSEHKRSFLKDQIDRVSAFNWTWVFPWLEVVDISKATKEELIMLINQF